MKFVDLFNSSREEAAEHAKILVGASGFESRARACVDLFESSRARRFAIGFKEYADDPVRLENDKTFLQGGFASRLIGRSDGQLVTDLMDELLAQDPSDAVLVDISSMTRVWYGAIVRYLVRLQRAEPLTVYFTYVPGHFMPPSEDVPRSEQVAPLDGFAGLGFPDRPVALVLGLGYEPERALGLRELLDPAQTVVLVPLVLKNDSYMQQVLKSNEEVLKHAEADWKFEYPIDDPVGSFRLVESIVSGLLNDFTVVMASLGPKVFGLECLLLSCKRPEISVWWASAGSGAAPRDVKPDTSRLIVVKTEWTEA